MSRLCKLTVCLLCLVLSLTALVLPAEATLQVASDGSQFTYTTLVHYQAGSKSIIGQIEDGSIVTILGENGNYYKVDCYDTTGYIAKNQISQKNDGKYYITCNPASSETKKMEHTAPADAIALRNQILTMARLQLGSRYVYGAATPGAFDCSGLTSYIYRRSGNPIHRAADTQLQDGLVVSREDLQVGDLVFFRASGSPWLASHVGIYAGNDQFIHASTSKGVIYSSLSDHYYRSTYIGARRIVTTGSLEVSAAPAIAENALTRTPSVGFRTAD